TYKDTNKHKDINNNIKENIKRKILVQLEQEDIQTSLKEKIKEWVEFRCEIKKPLKTYRPISKILNSSWVRQPDAIKFMEWCMNHEWQGLEEEFYLSFCKTKTKKIPEEIKPEDYAREVEEYYASLK
ncbi:hypothetical protein, partial [Fusobacterium necrophorum]